MVELLGVVAIIAVLSTIAIAGVMGSVNAAHFGSYNREIQVLNTSYQSYIAAGGNLPPYTALDRASRKDNAKLAVNLLLDPLTTPYGVVGPFVTQAPTDWYIGNYMGGEVAGVTKYIGFDAVYGFRDVGPD